MINVKIVIAETGSYTNPNPVTILVVDLDWHNSSQKKENKTAEIIIPRQK